VAYFYLLYLAKASKQDEEFYSNMFFWLMIFGILGAKLLYLVVSWREMPADARDFINCLRGGLVWYGGLVADLIFVYFYCRAYKQDYLHVSDTLAGPTALGLAIGRVGCLMAGCCYGKACDLPWAIVYHNFAGLPAHPLAGIPVHPSPVYESLGVLVIVAVCYLLFTYSHKRGLTLAMLVWAYAALRFGLEFLRGDVERGFVFSDKISTSQFVSILLFIPGMYFFIRQLLKPAEPEPKEPPKPMTKKEKKKKKQQEKAK
jgi:phosphatidylglycerol---prolipoprotein diacylglyceryl transferase